MHETPQLEEKGVPPSSTEELENSLHGKPSLTAEEEVEPIVTPKTWVVVGVSLPLTWSCQ